MSRERRKTYLEERIAIARKRLNEDTVEGFNQEELARFSLDLIDVLDGGLRTITDSEFERFLEAEARP